MEAQLATISSVWESVEVHYVCFLCLLDIPRGVLAAFYRYIA